MPPVYSGVYVHSKKEERGHGKERSYKARAEPWRKTTKPAALCIWASWVGNGVTWDPTGLRSPTLLGLQLALHAASFLGSSAHAWHPWLLGSLLHRHSFMQWPLEVGGGSFRGIPQFCHILPDFSDFLEHRYKLPWPYNLHSCKPHTLWWTLPRSVASLKRALAPFILPLLWPLCALAAEPGETLP